jgi:Tfp pilus assembly protein PilW
MRSAARSEAFSLIELLAATVVAVLVVGATTGSVLAAQRLEHSGEAAGARLAAAAALWERLRSLPFCDPAASAQGTLAETVFPRADTNADQAGGHLCVEAQDGCPPGTFFTTIQQDGLTFRVAANFCLASASGFTALPVGRLTAYAPLAPPAGRLQIRIRSADDRADLLVGVLAGSSRPDGAP